MMNLIALMIAASFLGVESGTNLPVQNWLPNRPHSQKAELPQARSKNNTSSRPENSPRLDASRNPMPAVGHKPVSSATHDLVIPAGVSKRQRQPTNRVPDQWTTVGKMRQDLSSHIAPIQHTDSATLNSLKAEDDLQPNATESPQDFPSQLPPEPFPSLANPENELPNQPAPSNPEFGTLEIGARGTITFDETAETEVQNPQLPSPDIANDEFNNLSTPIASQNFPIDQYELTEHDDPIATTDNPQLMPQSNVPEIAAIPDRSTSEQQVNAASVANPILEIPSPTTGKTPLVEPTKPDRPWYLLTITIFGLFASIAGNCYLGSTALTLYHRYHNLLKASRHERR